MIRVVVVEDEKMIRKGIIMTTDWQSYGCQVVGEAQSGEEGLSVIREKKPHLVLTDIRMKGMTGIEMIEELKGEDSIQFIILSGYSDFEYARSALRLGVTDYLLKPFQDEELTKALKHAVEKIHSREKEVEEDFSFFQEYQKDKRVESNPYLLKSIQYLEENYMKDVSCQKVAEEIGISESYLGKLFRKETGYTFVDYLTLTRMKKAVLLLRKDPLKIYELAYLVGYNDAHYFSNLFKKITGKSPSAYKRELSIEQQHQGGEHEGN